MPTVSPNATPGRSLVSRRAIVDIVRTATLGSYGVIGFTGGPLDRIGEHLGLPQRGIAVRLGSGSDGRGIEVDLDLVVAHGVPIAEVARQVDSAIRYATHQALGRDVDRLTIHVDGLRVAGLDVLHRGHEPAHGADAERASPDELAASGTDVA